MAIELLNATRNYLGQSTDTKPTVDIPAGSTFLETDTNKQYVFTGTEWADVSQSVVGAIGNEADEAVADPTASGSVIALLKGVLDNTGNIKIDAGSVNLNTDDLEVVANSTNALLNNWSNAIFDASSACMSTDGEIGSLDSSPATDNTSSWSLNSLLKGIFGKLGGVVLGSGTAIIGSVKQTDGTNIASINTLGEQKVSVPERRISSFTTSAVNVTSTASTIGTSAYRKQLTVFNTSLTDTVYYGASNAVTTSTGQAILPNDYAVFDFTVSASGVSVYFISASTVAVRITEVY